MIGGGGQVRGDIERGRGCCGRGRCGLRHGGATGVLAVLLATWFVLAEYARYGERRVRRCGRLDGRRLAAAPDDITRGGRRRRHRTAVTSDGDGRTAFVATFVVVVVAGHVDPR